MIDTIRVYTKVNYDNINQACWDVISNQETGEFYLKSFINNIYLGYYPDTDTLIISGKYISLYSKDKIRNFDDMFSKESMKNFFENLNKKINRYFYSTEIDILKCKITRMDYCFNVHTPYVEEYIEFFNLYYMLNREKKFKKYINHTDEKDLELFSSFYLKTKKQYKKKANQNFTLNLYNKENQLIYKQEEDIKKYGKSSIKDEDIENAKDILRLEVQLHHDKLKTVCKRHGIDWYNRCLYDFVDINIARDTLYHEISRFFTDKNFCSYKYTKAMLIKNNCTGGILDYIRKVSMHNKVSSYREYAKKLKNLDIFPYMFIPPTWGIDVLENPIKLIDKKIEANNLSDLKIERKEYIEYVG